MSEKRRIIIADDELAIRKIFEAILNKERYDIILVEDGDQAWAEVKRWMPQLVVTDLNMPGLNGIELLRNIKSVYPAIEVIIMTAYATLDVALDAVRGQAFDFMMKPFADTRSILNTINQALTKEELAREKNRLTMQLQDANATLEQKVQLRTVELANKNNELNLAYDKLKLSQELIIRREKLSAIGQLVAGVAHELRNPLGIIENSRFDLVDQLGSNIKPEMMVCLERIERNIARAQKIIYNLLNYSHYSSAEREMIDLNTMLQLTSELLTSEMKQSGIKLITTYSEIPDVKANSDGLKQSFLNIMQNAIQAMENCKTKELTILTGKYNGESAVYATIKDTGVGMPTEVVSEIFNPFFTTKEAGKGTGLGLSITYSAIEREGGRIEVESIEGQGTNITVILNVKL